MNLEIKIEVANGGRPVKTTQHFIIEFEFDKKYRAEVEKTINGKVSYECGKVWDISDGEPEELETDNPLFFIQNTIENLLAKHGIGEPVKKDE
jgi:hypothetical protein